MKRNERNYVPPETDPELSLEETVDHLEEAALETEAPESKELTDHGDEPDEGAEPAFDQDLDVDDLPAEPGQASRSASEPSG